MSHSIMGRLMTTFAKTFTNQEIANLVFDIYEGLELEMIGDKLDRTTLVRHVMSYAEREGTLPRLLQEAAAMRPGTPLPALVDEYLADERKSSDKRLRDQLEDILTEFDVSADLLLSAYRMFIAQRLVYAIDETRFRHRVYLREAVIEILSRNVAREPLLHVVLYLADSVSGEASLRFHHWIESATNSGLFENVNLGAAREHVMRKVRQYRERRLHLLVVVHPPGDGEMQFTVTAWRQFVNVLTDEGDPMVNVADGRTCERGALREMIAHLVARMETEQRLLRTELGAPTGGARNLQHRMIVELFLPYALFVEDADQWAVRIQPQPEFTLGKRHSVVLRSYERSYRPEMERVLNSWERFWMAHRSSSPKAKLCDRIIMTDGSYIDVVDAGDICCVVIPFPLLERDVPAVIEQVVMSGTPVCLWPRRDPPWPSEFGERLSRHDTDWRQLVGDARRAAVKGKAHHGHHLALLWDDYDRIPPDALPNAPQLIPEA